MAWPLGLQRLYYVGNGATLSTDSMSVDAAGGGESPTGKLKILRVEIQMRPDAKGIGSLFPKNGGKRGRHAVQFLLCGYRKVRKHSVYYDKMNWLEIDPVKKDFCSRRGIFTNHMGDSNKYSLTFYTHRN